MPLGCEVIELYSEVDGRFPNHHPDPSKPENLRDLVAAVQQRGCELGLAMAMATGWAWSRAAATSSTRSGR